MPAVNVAGYLTAGLGVGEVARGYIAALRSLGGPLAFTDFALGTASPKDVDAPAPGDAAASAINVVCVNADQMPGFAAYAGAGFFEGRRNIGAWSWELPEFPADWDDRFAPFDEIWVGSTYMQDAIARRSPIPVVKVPTVVAPDVPEPRPWSHYGLADGPFTFLFVFDYFSVFARKNPLAVIEAFLSAFPAGEPVRLVLKSLNGEQDPAHHRLVERAATDARIVLLNQAMSKDDKNGLIGLCDCYVSLHRAEGFGLTLAEAMYLGKPVIATGWSGNMDFMTAGNSFPVGFKLEALTRDHGPYKQGQLWAEPEVAHAAALMREVFTHPEAARARGRQAAEDIRRELGLAAVAARIRDRLGVLRSARAGAAQPPWMQPSALDRTRFFGLSVLRLAYRAGRGLVGRWLGR
jgi:glycosyltransferase involved in cell wall biosynthesis